MSIKVLTNCGAKPQQELLYPHKKSAPRGEITARKTADYANHADENQFIRASLLSAPIRSIRGRLRTQRA